MNEIDFKYYSLNGFLEINSLSPNHKYFYKISSIDESSMAWWTCKIAFYDNTNSLLYYRAKIHIAWLFPYNKLTFVKWSKDGNFALVFEYKRDIVNDYLLLSFIDKFSYRINSRTVNCDFLEEVENFEYNGIEIMNKILKLGGLQQLFIQNPINNFLRKWYPNKAKL